MDAVVPCEALAIGAHPDDVEIATAGTLLLLRQQQVRVGIVDCTRGEKGTSGTAAERAAEATAAAGLLAVEFRHNLGLPDAGVRADDAATAALVAVLRRATPRLLLAPHAEDPHPDHAATAALCARACFLAGLRNYEPQLGAPHRPRLLLRYPGNRPVPATLVIDISAVAAQKADVLRCYRSQRNPADRSHLLQGLDVLERAQVRDRFFGASIGVAAGEAFCHDGPLPAGIRTLLG
jgi:bacillithiol biosynthesis deacetylase BshB1